MYPFADTPQPPYTAVIFTSLRAVGGDNGYAETAARMIELARQRPGYLGIESARDEQTGTGITVSYWTDEWAAHAWKEDSEHLQAQRRARDEWYVDYRVYVATVKRAYGKHTDRGSSA